MAIRFDAYVRAQGGVRVGSDFQTPTIAKLLTGGQLARGVSYYLYLLLSEDGTRFSVHVVDTDRMRFLPRPFPWRRRMRNLAQLAASIPVLVTRADRLRWWRCYARTCGLGGRDPERRAAADVMRLLARKRGVTDAPIE